VCTVSNTSSRLTFSSLLLVDFIFHFLITYFDICTAPTESETTPPYSPRSSRFSSEPPSVEDDVDVWRYAIVRVACQKRRRRLHWCSYFCNRCTINYLWYDMIWYDTSICLGLGLNFVFFTPVSSWHKCSMGLEHETVNFGRSVSQASRSHEVEHRFASLVEASFSTTFGWVDSHSVPLCQNCISA